MSADSENVLEGNWSQCARRAHGGCNFDNQAARNRLTCELSHVWLFARLKSRLPRLVFGRGICVANVVWELAEGSAETRHFSLFHGGIANQALEATSARDEGEDGREKSVKRKKRILIEIR